MRSMVGYRFVYISVHRTEKHAIQTTPATLAFADLRFLSA